MKDRHHMLAPTSRREFLFFASTLLAAFYLNGCQALPKPEIKPFTEKEKALLAKEEKRLVSLWYFHHKFPDFGGWVKTPTTNPLLEKMATFKGTWSSLPEKFIPQPGMEETIPTTFFLLSGKADSNNKYAAVYYCHTERPKVPLRFLPNQNKLIKNEVPPLYPEYYVVTPAEAHQLQPIQFAEVFHQIKELNNILGDQPSEVV